MSELIDIIISAVDQASDTFESVVSSADDAASSLENMGTSAEDIPTDAIENTAEAVDQVEQEADESTSAFESMNSAITAIAGAEVFSQMADTLMDCADKAGNFQDSIMRASLEAEGAGINVNDMTDTISKLSSETGRAGGQIREAFVKATARGITNLDSFKTMMEGAGAQATLFNTDIETMGNKFSQMAMRSRLMEKSLSETGITVAELGEAMGMQGATIDEINAKWETMDINQRAAILGTAASMNEGEDANEAYKNSWAGLHEQIDIAKGRIERLVGQVLLPVLVPAMKAAANVLDWLGDVIDGVMSGPLGGFVSVIGAVAAGILLAVPAVAAMQAAMGIFTASIWPAVAASWALISPWLPWIAIGAAIVLIIYEIGKAFGWWDDAGEMIDAISDGLQKMWDAFINHPDVQAAIQALSEAWGVLMEVVGEVGQAVLDFFGINEEGNFDIVRALIDGIGAAWDNIRTILGPVIDFVMQVVNAFNLYRTGQLDLPGLIMSVLTSLLTLYSTILNSIINFVIGWASQILSYMINAARNAVNGAVNWFKQLPGKIYSALVSAVSKIVSAGQQWVTNAKNKAQSVVDNVYSTLSSIPGKISSALSGVVSAITQPFKDAYDQICKTVSDIQSKASEVLNISLGWEIMDFQNAGVDLSTTSNVNTSVTPVITGSNGVSGELTVIHDLQNLPNGVTASEVADIVLATASDNEFGKAIAQNTGFQGTDYKLKQTLANRMNRTLGV